MSKREAAKRRRDRIKLERKLKIKSFQIQNDLQSDIIIMTLLARKRKVNQTGNQQREESNVKFDEQHYRESTKRLKKDERFSEKYKK